VKRNLLLIALFFPVLLAAGKTWSSDPVNLDSQLAQADQDYFDAQYDQALAGYQKALTLDDQNAAAFYGQGLALAQMGKWAEAEGSFRRAVELDPERAKAWLGWGWAQGKKGDKAGAIHSFQKIFQLVSTEGERELAQKELALLGGEVPVATPIPSANVPSNPQAVPEWKPLVSLQDGGGLDDNVDSGSLNIRPQNTGALSDGFWDFLAQGRLSSATEAHPGFRFDGSIEDKGYFTYTDYSCVDLNVKAAYESPLFSWLRGGLGIGGQDLFQNQGVGYTAGYGWAELKAREGGTRLTARYSFNLENYNNWYATPGSLAQGPALNDPSDVNHQIDLKAYQNLFPWVTLNARYRFKDNEATELTYQYLQDGVGAGVEFFLFNQREILAGLQLNYFNTTSRYPNVLTYNTPYIYVFRRDSEDLFTAELDVPFKPGWSAGAYYRYSTDNSNVFFFSYVDHLVGVQLSYQLL